ncbi:MAG: GDP-fucose synthetase [Candidatus Liptonbacteria bacterium RIFCSPHIGHO2_01_FULL_57_28]|uniref:GDP-L-fucose synthase n=1 Tax=Candidatus Liptonbacteria bacterium RIFCSPHIGHO2_01_FULL_57_28 TaxID=1798647 RepID=A0A1G2C9H2_9BACT|nr:MAG: GDP-fucose synthetase [Candidatus Liptonbacteria bacterium RIFCSPHIGHO2_01_FULL_57_28]
MELKGKNILVTGGSGFLGGYVTKELVAQGADPARVKSLSSQDYDLRHWDECVKAVQGQDIVIHLAGVVGGIGFNREKPGELFYDNLMMGVQLIEAARQAGVKKFVAIGTICAYPKFAPIPFKEDDIWNGYPEETNAPYGLAKKMLLVQAQAYRQQYGMNAIALFPVNLYGPGDNFDPKSSHVIAAIIQKTYDAVQSGADHIELWGDGTPTREFVYAADAAKGIVLATIKYDKPEPVNIGSGMEISIKELAGLITKHMGFKGEIRWDTTKPNGQPRRRLDVSRAEKEFGFKAQTSFEEGLKNVIDSYIALKKT